MPRGDAIWAAWLAGTTASFAVLEYRAFHGRYPTLSRTLAVWLGIEPVHRFHRPARVGFALAWAILVVHLHTQPKQTVVRMQPDQYGRTNHIPK